TTIEVISGIGWFHGTESQVSLPNIVLPRWRLRRNALRRWCGLGRDRRKRPIGHDVIEQLRIRASVGEGLHIAAGLLELLERLGVERRPGMGGCRPRRELGGRDRMNRKAHAGEAV